MKRRFNAIILALALTASCGIISLSASENESWPCCDNYRGTATRLLEHVKIGEDCIAKSQTYCIECGTIFDTWEQPYCPCPH